MKRRTYLGISTAGGLSFLAGCLGGDEREAAGERESESDEDDFYNAAAVSIDDHPITDPVPFSDEHRCPVCNMQPIDWWIWAAQLAHDDGTGLFFETAGCLLAYRAVTRSHPTEAPIERVWFTDFETGELFDAADGFLVEETDLEAQDEPMSGSPVPFSSRERAVSYVEDAEHLETDAIVTLDDVDRAFAEFYRGDRMPTG